MHVQSAVPNIRRGKNEFHSKNAVRINSTCSIMLMHVIMSIHKSAGAVSLSAGAGNRGVKGYEIE